ncbi:NAD(P)H-dependent glycerol-3-phosphate dehydrogenase [Paraburkholderia caballeronis]|uniref:Glycerol-3-phosphate dehydrogenase [NAD(P)+] n=1 Tax=Paraburkholderia caballeronis TaxID=416943 RepID=A0A1H7HT61_9BURK|nr:NAD(P)H-dependent glycerol-3-phosphate dehydrogenase [Paraburkholderia caballeronis]PXW29370.1 glycerol-3-phosphate dehydrogenase (NAD(P)+) [Paraburkholderia caballeronis]PXX04629.1 glycerol-3-phosphate dehydrogenase (NAD(P)+) [Paraburkholderia caballeronis]RAK05690.1 glycerol-3-phosphate dehydrogenase (NAD(P)+) [Paraburkholderia caballeronis]SEC99326.1 glycerol-3-phosphate dehydrogenase (NAD(P)+) [Paraburkholderia caballeronis]SEK53546.1 glycerol-3-phosphate dehydrogenase (NAD(P)+) [Parabu
MKVAVLGAGAWGTALAGHLATAHDTVLWARDTALIDTLRTTHENARYLAGVLLPDSLRYETSLDAALGHAVDDAALVVVATPVAGLRGLLRAMRDAGKVPAHFVWLCKGFEADTQLLPHQVVAAELPAHRSNGVLSGPSFAREVGEGLPVALTVASASAACRERTLAAFHHRAMRIYTGDDIVGVEVGGAVKNVLAIATGISDGLGLGLNARAALITRGLAEMSRLGVTLGGRAETFMGLTGLGDLILTATGDLSRNRTVGMQLAKGRTLDDVLGGLGHVAEGVRCAQAVLAIARAHAIDMPITQAVCAVLFEGVAPRDAVSALLRRDAKAE